VEELEILIAEDNKLLGDLLSLSLSSSKQDSRSAKSRRQRRINTHANQGFFLIPLSEQLAKAA
jgi:hypothetical protein